MDHVAWLLETPPALHTATLLLGLCLGSFLNVVIYRLPLRLEHEWRTQSRELLGEEPPEDDSSPPGIVRPPSRCRACGHQIRAVENIPVVSYLLLRGKCASCGNRISLRYPFIEILTALAIVAVVIRFDASVASLFAIILTCGLIVLTFIDFDHQILPDNITLPLLWLGLAANLFGLYADLESAVIGAAAGYLTLWSVYHLFRLISGKEGMGYGDFKLLGCLGAWLGWQMLPLVIILSSVVGVAVGIFLVVFRNHQREQPIPFGPYLAVAGWLALMWGEPLTQGYLNLFNVTL